MASVEKTALIYNELAETLMKYKELSQEVFTALTMITCNVAHQITVPDENGIRKERVKKSINEMIDTYYNTCNSK